VALLQHRVRGARRHHPPRHRQLSDQELRELITAPLGLAHTTLALDPSPLGPLAHPYSVIDPGAGAVDVFARSPKMPSAYFGPVWTDRGVASTAADVATFEDDLYGGRLLQPGSLQQMLTAGLNPMYGLGTLIDPTIPGHLLVGHDGHKPGWVAVYLAWLRQHGAVPAAGQRAVTPTALTDLAR
jgi:CubicO group peptidase (beta-lactamase class C family)